MSPNIERQEDILTLGTATVDGRKSILMLINEMMVPEAPAKLGKMLAYTTHRLIEFYVHERGMPYSDARHEILSHFLEDVQHAKYEEMRQREQTDLLEDTNIEEVLRERKDQLLRTAKALAHRDGTDYDGLEVDVQDSYLNQARSLFNEVFGD